MQPNGGTHFRVWALRPRKVEVVLEAGPGAPDFGEADADNILQIFM